MKIYIKSSAPTGNYCIVFDNVIVNFFHTTYTQKLYSKYTSVLLTILLYKKQ